MKNIIKQWGKIILRSTEVSDLEFVIDAEQKEENAMYIGQWSEEEHINSFSNEDILHLIIEDRETNVSVGYMIVVGVKSPNKEIELKRIVISEKGKGYGRETLRLVKELSFNDLKAHRLWLDVRVKNKKAQYIYKSEGFKEEGTLRECILYKGKYESIIIMSILENEYFLKA